MKSFVIGGNERETVKVTVLNYERPAVAGEFYDDNWLACEVFLQVGAFRGKFSACFLTSELTELLQHLQSIQQELRGSYTFEPMEGQLVLRISCNHSGHVIVAGEAMDRAGSGNTLAFELSVDQTYLAATVGELSELVRTFPVRA